MKLTETGIKFGKKEWMIKTKNKQKRLHFSKIIQCISMNMRPNIPKMNTYIVHYPYTRNQYP